MRSLSGNSQLFDIFNQSLYCSDGQSLTLVSWMVFLKLFKVETILYLNHNCAIVLGEEDMFFMFVEGFFKPFHVFADVSFFLPTAFQEINE